MEHALRGMVTRGAVLFALCLLGRVDGFTGMGKLGSRKLQQHGGKQGLCLKRASRIMGQDVGSIRASASLGDSSARSDKATTSPSPPNPATPSSFPFSESTTLSFLADESLTSLERGFGVESDIFPLCGKRWQVVLYPYGQRKDGPPFGFKGVNGAFRPTHASYGRIGIYLRYVPDSKDDFADCVFTLALKGQQQSGPRFDVAFDCGMRFASAQNADTSSGVASDWGAHVAPSSALADFTRTTGNGAGEVSVQVNVTVYGMGEIGRDGRSEESEEGVDAKVGTAVLKLLTPGMDSAARRKLGVFWRLPSDVRSQLRVGQVVIPTTLTGNNGGEWMKVRDRMFEVGAYPGVEYRIMGMKERGTGRVLFKVPDSEGASPAGGGAGGAGGGAGGAGAGGGVHPGRGDDGDAAGADGGGSGVDLVIRPIYPLEKRLERQWPVTVAVDDVPSYLTQAMYNSLTLIGTAAWSASLILLILLGREAISFYKIPTASMEPTIARGDLILAEKLTPKFRPPSRGEVILFNPPQGLRDVVESQGGTLGSRDLFVKRVAATPGDVVTVDSEGKVDVNGQALKPGTPGGGAVCDEPNGAAQRLVRPQKGKVKQGTSFVLGDCAPVSVDSRVWGTLSDQDFRARAVITLWPPAHFGLSK